MEVDAISGPDRQGTYSQKHQRYKNSLANYRYAIKQQDIADEEERDVREKAFNYALQKNNGVFDIFSNRYNKAYNTYPGLQEAIDKNYKAETYLYNKKKEY